MPKGIFIWYYHSEELRTPIFVEGIWHYLGCEGVMEKKGILLLQPSFLNLGPQQFLVTVPNLFWKANSIMLLTRLEFLTYLSCFVSHQQSLNEKHCGLFFFFFLPELHIFKVINRKKKFVN